jgi:hypothetical protein
MADDSGIDPRYAAQFQRGFDPAVHATAPVRDAVPRRDAPVRLAGGPVTTAVRVPDGPVPRARPVVAEPPVPSVEVEPEEPEEFEENLPARRRPIAEWVLLGMSAVQFVAAYAALWLQWNSQSDGFGFGAGIDGMLLFVFMNSLPGPLFLGGVVALILWVALRAAGRPSR